jgi:hypothetical protein
LKIFNKGLLLQPPLNFYDEPRAEEQQEHGSHLRKEKVQKQKNKTARPKKKHPPALACATANQNATSTLLDHESHGES